MIHATRLFILNDFTDLSRRPLMPLDLVATHVRNCIDAAKDIMQRVDAMAGRGSMLESFWFTHYICFCAILVVYIYTIQQHQSSQNPASPSLSGSGDEGQDLFSLAETCQVHLAKATRKNCPSRRYGIILEELRLDVHRQLASDPNLSQIRRPPGNEPSQTENLKEAAPKLDQPSTALPLNSNFEQYIGNTAIPDLDSSDLFGGDGFNFLDNLDGSVWWTQLDSWVSCLLVAEKSKTNLLLLSGIFEFEQRLIGNKLLRLSHLHLSVI